MNPDTKALIIDDEAMACDMLEYLVRKHVPVITAIKKATGAAEGLRLIESFQPQLLFLDIQMPFMNGFELLRALPAYDFSVIFTTAYDKYAVKAIRFSALDYLLKPVDAEELKAAVQRFAVHRKQKMEVEELYRNFMDNLQQKQPGKYRLALYTAQGIRLVEPAEVLYCCADNNYTWFYCTDGKNILVSKTIKEYEDILKEHHFLRVHKSYLVNFHFVRGFTHDNRLLLTNGVYIEVSRRRKPDVLELLKNKQRKPE